MNARRHLYAALCTLVVGVLLLLPACGGGGWVARGGIEVVNSPFSFEFVDAVRVVETFGPDVWFFQTFLVPGESLLVDGLYPTWYDVTVYWSDGSRDTFFDVEVDPGWITTLPVEN